MVRGSGGGLTVLALLASGTLHVYNLHVLESACHRDEAPALCVGNVAVMKFRLIEQSCGCSQSVVKWRRTQGVCSSLPSALA